MVSPDEHVYAEIQFADDQDIPASDLSILLSQLEDFYRVFQRNTGILSDIVPSEMDEEIFYDETAKEVFVGRLHKYGVLGDIRDLYPLYNPQSHVYRYVSYNGDYEGLEIRRLKKESPFLIGLTGSGLFIAILWVIEGIEYNRKEEIQIDNEGNMEKDITKEFKFNATSTTDLIAEIREFFK